MNLKERLETSPIAFAVIVAVATASTVGGAMLWVMSQRIDMEKSKVELGFMREKVDLERRLLGVERRLSDHETYFDLGKLLIPRNDVPALPKQFQSFQSGAVFVDVPDGDDWRFIHIDPGSLKLKDASGTDIIVNQLTTTVPQVTADIWLHTTTLTINATPITDVVKGGPKIFQPSAILQAVSREDVAAAFKALADYASAQTSKPLPPDTPRPTPGVTGAREFIMATGRSVEAMATLIAIALPWFDSAVYKGTDFRLVNLQYRHPMLVIETEVSYNEPTSRIPRSAQVRLLCLVVRTDTTYVVLNTVAPTIEGRSLSLPWLTRWVAGVRIPI